MLKILSASAGAGKTFQLARIYIELLMRLNGRNRHRHILAVTFTKKATAEMKERIVEELDKLAHNKESDHLDYLMQQLARPEAKIREEAQVLLTDILQDYSTFGISTIDSFFQIILRNFAKELSLQGQYNIELDSDTIREEAVDKFIFDLKEGDYELQQFTQLLKERIEENGSVNGKNAFVIKEDLLALAKLLDDEDYFVNKEEFDKILADKQQFLQLLERLKAKREEAWEEYQKISVSADDYTQCKDFKRTIESRLRYSRSKFMEESTALTSVQLTAVTLHDWTLLAPKSAKPDVQSAVERVLDALTEIHRCLQTAHECNFYLNSLPYLIYLSNISQNIDKRNQELNRFPLAETNSRILDLIRLDPESPFIYEKVGRRLLHYLIDEFQDTNTMQWESFRPLIDESLSTETDALTDLIVGDTKQSIYRWRNANYKLMQTQVESDFQKYASDKYQPVLRDGLDSNFRSLKNVVETNNIIFDSLAQYFENQQHSGVFAQVYEWKTLEQKVKKYCKKADEEGYVRMEFYPLGEGKQGRWQMSEMLKNEALDEHIVATIQDAHARGVKYSQIALLCRGHKEITHLAQLLAAHNISTISEGGLLINSCLSIRFMVNLLKSILQPKNDILQLFLREQYTTLLRSMPLEITHSLTFPTENLLSLTLCEQIETIIKDYHLDLLPDALIYLQAFRDCVYQYQADKGSDLLGFLEWWDKKKDKLSLSLSAQEGAVQILTIHKSKGLQYQVVIVPYCVWDILPDANKPITLWAEPRGIAKELGCDLPKIPIKWGDKLNKYGYEEIYQAEKESLYLDNLNLLYVAFTRAVTELWVFAGDNNGVGKELFTMMQNNPDAFPLSTDAAGCSVFEIGKKADFKGIAECEKKATDKPRLEVIQREYTSEQLTPQSAYLTLKKPLEHWLYDEEQEPQNEYLERLQRIGTLIHKALQDIHAETELNGVLDQMQQDGLMEKTERYAVYSGVKNCFDLVRSTGKDWFGEGYKVMNEQPILTTNSKTQRPDRLLIKGNRAIVIDYKTSRREPEQKVAEERRQQVRDYMLLLQQMGYEVEGYLCYMNLKRIEEVKL